MESVFRFVERTGVLPKGLENKYRGALYSRDPTVVVQGANAIARLVSLNPTLAQDIPADEVQRARPRRRARRREVRGVARHPRFTEWSGRR